MEKDTPSSRTTKSSFFSRTANFGNVSPFLVGATNTFFELIHPLIKLPNCVLKFYNLSDALDRLFQLTPRPFEEQAQALLTYCHLHSFLIFHFIYYISQRSNAKNCVRITGYSVMVRSQVQTIYNTRYSLSREITECIKFTDRVEFSCKQIFDSSKTFFTPLVGTNSLYGKRTVVFFFLSPHKPSERVRVARFARVRLLRHALPISLLILRKKKQQQLFCSLV